MNKRELEIRENVKRVKERIERAAYKANWEPSDITLVGVTKNFPAEDIEYAINAGIEIAGENRVQELLEKYEKVKPKQWHLIGHLQKNKAKYIVGKVKLIHSVDSKELVCEIDRQAKKNDVIQDILIQVNTSNESTKFGCSTDELDDILFCASEKANIRVRGLMTIAPLYVKEVTTMLHFDNTRKLYIDRKENKYDNINMEYLSMGMSADFEQAIYCGANMVRVGSAVFGQRNYK